MKIINWLLSGLDKFNRVIINVGLIGLFAIMVIDTVSIVGIWFGKRVVPGDKGIIEECIILVIYAGMAYVYFERGHLKTEILKKHFPPLLHFSATLLGWVITLGVSIYVGITTFSVGLFQVQTWCVAAGDVPIATGPFIWVISFSFFNVALCALLFLIKECLTREVLRARTQKAT